MHNITSLNTVIRIFTTVTSYLKRSLSFTDLTTNNTAVSQINPTRCTILFNIFIYFSSRHISGIHVPIIRRKLLYLCDTGICHSAWVVSGLLVGLEIQPADQSPPIHSDKYQYRMDTVIFS